MNEEKDFLISSSKNKDSSGNFVSLRKIEYRIDIDAFQVPRNPSLRLCTRSAIQRRSTVRPGGAAVLLVSDEYDKSCIQYRSFEREVYLIWVCFRIVRQSLSLHDAVVEHFIHSLTASLLNEGISKM